ncbi:head completion/stabilization protein [Thalassolituus oleivorans]|uniref:head completion/stabilization protein n=1 Tax=Thalassolituus oleivorans TaxID=187493 RepID=UPI0023F379A0|nr:head completion/stabilization protein [Thalassolituus oleivorans]
MAFIANTPEPEDEGNIDNFNDFWPALSLPNSREILRLESDITTSRLTALLQNAMIDVNHQLESFVAEQTVAGITYDQITNEKKHLYTRAIYATAQAQLLSDMRDYDSTQSAQDKTDTLKPSIDEQRRIATISIRQMLGKSFSHVELI